MPNDHTKSYMLYSLIAFDKRVTFWLQRTRLLPCEYGCTQASHANNATYAHAQGSDLVR